MNSTPTLGGIIETALYVDDLERSVTFYQKVFSCREEIRDDLICVLGLPAGEPVQALILFPVRIADEPPRRSSPAGAVTGMIPDHGARGRMHVAFAIPANALDGWVVHLGRLKIPIEGRVDWNRGGTSLYFRDPDNHLIELVTPGLWSFYESTRKPKPVSAIGRRWLHRDGGRLSYEVLGGGKTTLLLLPGWCESRTVFEPFIERAAEHFRIVSLDWRGHGESDQFSADFCASDLVEDCLALLDQTGTKSCIPLAIAHASWIAAELAVRVPQRFMALVFLDWIMNSPPPEFFRAVENFQNPATWMAAREELFEHWLAGSTDPVIVSHIRGDLSRLGFEMWARAGREIIRAYHEHTSPLNLLEHLQPECPTLHLYSLNRDPAYLALQEEFQRNHEWFTVERLPTRTHLPVLEAPDLVLENLTAWLRKGFPSRGDIV